MISRYSILTYRFLEVYFPEVSLLCQKNPHSLLWRWFHWCFSLFRINKYPKNSTIRSLPKFTNENNYVSVLQVQAFLWSTSQSTEQLFLAENIVLKKFLIETFHCTSSFMNYLACKSNMFMCYFKLNVLIILRYNIHK